MPEIVICNVNRAKNALELGTCNNNEHGATKELPELNTGEDISEKKKQKVNTKLPDPTRSSLRAGLKLDETECT